jgi:hypothetical protein
MLSMFVMRRGAGGGMQLHLSDDRVPNVAPRKMRYQRRRDPLAEHWATPRCKQRKPVQQMDTMAIAGDANRSRSVRHPSNEEALRPGRFEGMVATTGLVRRLPTSADFNFELPDVVEAYNIRTSQFHSQIVSRIGLLSVRHNKPDAWLPRRGKYGNTRREQQSKDDGARPPHNT